MLAEVAGSEMHALATLVAALLLGGCATHPEYPEAWTPGYPKSTGLLAVAEFDSVCRIAGSYADKGEAPPRQDEGAGVSLGWLLFPESRLESSGNVDRVTLRGPENGILEFTAWSSGRPVWTRQLLRQADATSPELVGRYRCLRNGLLIANSGGAAGSVGVTLAGFAHDNFLYRDTEGWLVLQTVDLSVAVPWFEYKRRWYRFRQRE